MNLELSGELPIYYFRERMRRSSLRNSSKGLIVVVSKWARY